MSRPARPLRGFGLIVLVMIALGACFPSKPSVSESSVGVSDPGLLECIEQKLGLLPGEPIAPTQMEALDELSCFQEVASLSGLESATNLTVLNLTENEIVDVSPLASLTNLTWLNLGLNPVTDLSSLAGLRADINLEA